LSPFIVNPLHLAVFLFGTPSDMCLMNFEFWNERGCKRGFPWLFWDLYLFGWCAHRASHCCCDDCSSATASLFCSALHAHGLPGCIPVWPWLFTGNSRVQILLSILLFEHNSRNFYTILTIHWFQWDNSFAGRYGDCGYFFGWGVTLADACEPFVFGFCCSFAEACVP
jgi:hypothetical protein